MKLSKILGSFTFFFKIFSLKEFLFCEIVVARIARNHFEGKRVRRIEEIPLSYTVKFMSVRLSNVPIMFCIHNLTEIIMMHYANF